MNELPGQEVGIDDFTSFIETGFSQTQFNGLKIGDCFEFRCELDKRVLVMKVTEIKYNNYIPMVTISHLQRMYTR